MSETIEAAGALVYRPASSGLEVCLIHRAKYDDWSFPKGKLEPRESHAHAAVREVQEETGIPIRLSTFLTDVTYPLHADGSEGSRDKSRKAGRHSKKQKKTKHVEYWIARILDDTTVAMRQEAFGAFIHQDNEADNVEWVSVAHAAQLLTYATDKDVLSAFEAGVEKEQTSATVIVVRHGKAESRKHWTGTEPTRPLTPAGAGASFALSRELACFGAGKLVTSPWTRCSQTLVPYAVSSHLDIETAEQLTEDYAQTDPQGSVQYFEQVLGNAAREHETPVVVCTHRPVLGELFPAIASLCADAQIAQALPSESPYLQTAYGLALSVSMNEDKPTITAIQRVEPIEY